MSRRVSRRAERELDAVLGESDAATGVLARELAHALRGAAASARLDGLVGPSQALGTLRAQQGHSPLAVVDEVVRLRDVIGATGGGVALALAADEVLRNVVAAYHEEALRVLGVAATRDALTGLANRLVFEDALQRNVARPSPPGPTLVVFDLDAFKALNDLRGHLGGDAALVAVAEVLQSTVRPGDVAARLGGDEFVVLLPAGASSTGVDVAERVVARALRRPEVADPEAPLGLSVGVATLLPGEQANDLLRRADAAMYAAKRAGGNRVEVAPDVALAAEQPRRRRAKA